MEVDPFIVDTQQPDLLEFRQALRGTAVDLVEVWGAAEALTSSNLKTRWSGFNRLVAVEAINFSPLVAYTIATRIKEPDIQLRTQLVNKLAELLAQDTQNQVGQASLLHLRTYLANLQTEETFALLQVADHDPANDCAVTMILGKCSQAGNYLAEILLDRQMPLSIRKIAAQYIGQIGYLDALPSLVRLESRLKLRLNGNHSSIEPAETENTEVSLLPHIQQALESLRAL